MTARIIQIDAIGPIEKDTNIIHFKIYIDGRTCSFYSSKANYEALMYDKIFIRNGKTVDSAGVINTTNPFFERKPKL